MAALAACEIDNALVELGGPELPIMDGSAQPFVFLIECAGVVEQDRPRRWIEMLKPVTVCGQDKSARLEPADRFEIDCAIHFDHPLIDSQALQFAFTPDGFKAEIARARTFGFAERIEELWSRGLGARRLAQERGRGQPRSGAERGGPALSGRVRPPQGAGQHRRPVHRGRRRSSAASSAAAPATPCTTSCCARCSPTRAPGAWSTSRGLGRARQLPARRAAIA